MLIDQLNRLKEKKSRSPHSVLGDTTSGCNFRGIQSF